MKAASPVYDVLITVDQNIPFQQNIADLPIAIVILAARRNSYAHLRPLVPSVLAVLEKIKPGDVIRVET